MAPPNAVRNLGQQALVDQADAVVQGLSDRSKSLLTVAEELGIITGKDAPEGVLVGAMTPDQQEQIRVAVIDALTAKRAVDYRCDIADPHAYVASRPGPGTKVTVNVAVGDTTVIQVLELR